jgi:hypothetical protein
MFFARKRFTKECNEMSGPKEHTARAAVRTLRIDCKDRRMTHVNFRCA